MLAQKNQNLDTKYVEQKLDYNSDIVHFCLDQNEFTEARNGIGIGFINEKESGITAKQAEVSVEAATEQEELPPIIWITGGPGSSKTRRMEECLTAFPGWRLVSSGRLLWAWTAAGLEEDDSEELEQAKIVGQLMAQGELVPSQLVIQLIWNELEKYRGTMTLIHCITDRIFN